MTGQTYEKDMIVFHLRSNRASLVKGTCPVCHIFVRKGQLMDKKTD